MSWDGALGAGSCGRLLDQIAPIVRPLFYYCLRPGVEQALKAVFLTGFEWRFAHRVTGRSVVLDLEAVLLVVCVLGGLEQHTAGVEVLADTGKHAVDEGVEALVVAAWVEGRPGAHLLALEVLA